MIRESSSVAKDLPRSPVTMAGSMLAGGCWRALDACRTQRCAKDCQLRLPPPLLMQRRCVECSRGIRNGSQAACQGPGKAHEATLSGSQVPEGRGCVQVTALRASRSASAGAHPGDADAACRMDESHLTGESGSVSKDPEGAPLALSGSRVLEGEGRILVTAVGLESQQGMILSSLTESQREGGLKCALRPRPVQHGVVTRCCGGMLSLAQCRLSRIRLPAGHSMSCSCAARVQATARPAQIQGGPALSSADGQALKTAYLVQIKGRG